MPSSTASGNCTPRSCLSGQVFSPHHPARSEHAQSDSDQRSRDRFGNGRGRGERNAAEKEAGGNGGETGTSCEHEWIAEVGIGIHEAASRHLGEDKHLVFEEKRLARLDQAQIECLTRERDVNPSGDRVRRARANGETGFNEGSVTGSSRPAFRLPPRAEPMGRGWETGWWRILLTCTPYLASPRTIDPEASGTMRNSAQQLGSREWIRENVARHGVWEKSRSGSEGPANISRPLPTSRTDRRRLGRVDSISRVEPSICRKSGALDYGHAPSDIQEGARRDLLEVHMDVDLVAGAIEPGHANTSIRMGTPRTDFIRISHGEGRDRVESQH